MSNNSVYHYCSVETFRKIISNKELWMTDVTKSNDSTELQLVFDTLSDVLNKRTDIRNKIRDDFIPLNMFKQFFDNFKKIEQLFHVCCFSDDRDSLSQWAMYANDATGIAIGFDKKYLMKLKESNEHLNFGKVQYSTKSLSEAINQKMNQLCTIYKMANKDDDNYSWYLEFMHYVIDDVMKMAYLYKNQSFKQEHEYRLVYNSKPCTCKEIINNQPRFTQMFIKNETAISSDVKICEINYYLSRERLVSYRPLKIKNIGSIINEIVIGPKSHVSIHDLEMFLIANEVDLSIHNITLSNSTYR